MTPYFIECLEKLPSSLDRVVAVAGTATSVVSVDKKMEVYDSDVVHGTVVSLDVLFRIYHSLALMPLEQRKQVVGLEPQRASVIVAGMLILAVVLKLAKMNSFTVSELDILHGILLEEPSNYLL